MSDSRLSSAVSTHSARAVHGGKITAQNPALLQMLREKTLEKEQNSTQKDEEPVRRLYVESPVFTKEDEDNIQFVNSDVEDDLRDSLEDGDGSNGPNDPDSVSNMPSLTDLISKTEVLKSRQNTNTSQFSKSGIASNPSARFDSSRYEEVQTGGDLDSENQSAMLSTPNRDKKNSVGHVGQEKVWHTLRNGFDSRNTSASGKSVNFRSTHTEIQIPDIVEDAEPDAEGDNDKENSMPPPQSVGKVITPIENPMRGLTKEQTKEMQELEEEERYQREMRARIEDATHQAHNIHIPKLDLDELSSRDKVVSDDDDQRVKKVTEMGLLDSLASTDRTVEGEPTLRDSLEQPSGNSQTWEKKYLELEQRLGRLEKAPEAVPSAQTRPHQGHPANQQITSGDLKNFQNPALSQRYEGEYQYNPELDQYVGTSAPNPPQRMPVQANTSQRQSSYRGNLPLNFAATEEGAGDLPVEPSRTVYPQDERSQESEEYYDGPQVNTNAAPPQPMPRQQYANQQYPYDQYPTNPVPEQYQQPETEYEGPISQPPKVFYGGGQQYPEDDYPDEQYQPQQQYANEQAPVQGAQPMADQHEQPNGFYSNEEMPKGYKEVSNKSPTPSRDYITLNKQVLRGEVGSAKTYGKKYLQKKEYSDRPPPAPPTRKKKPGTTQTAAATNDPSVQPQSRVPTSNNTSGGSHPAHSRLPPPLEGDVDEDENLSAEQRWAKRAQVLSVKKDKQTGNKPQSKASLRKHPSAGQVENLRHNERRGTYSVNGPQSQQSSALHRQNATNPTSSPPRQTLHDRGISPGKTYTLDNARNYTAAGGPEDRLQHQQQQQALTHSLVTGNGQKMDVDINVKVLNPPQPGYPENAGFRPVQRQVPVIPQHQQQQQSQYGSESPLQIQSVNSSAGTIRQPLVPVHNPHLVSLEQYKQPRHQPPPPQHSPYNGPGYHFPASQPQHYNYSAPEHVQQDSQGYRYPRNLPYNLNPQQQGEPRYGNPQQPPPQQQYQSHPSVPGAANVRPQGVVQGIRGQSRQPQHVPTQPIQAFQPFQESFDHYDQGYPGQSEYIEVSGATSPSSYRGGYDGTPTPGNMSPYKVVPPIGPAEEKSKKQPYTQYSTSVGKNKGSSRSHPEDVEVYGASDRGGGAGGSYMDTFEKNKSKKRVQTYKPYTLNDYRKMQKEVRLGGLGPDLGSDSVKEKKDKLDRQLNYAKSINERNREEYELEKTKPRPQTYTLEEEEEEQDVIDRRRLALEYAKSVPKPKVRAQDDPEPDSIPSSAATGRPRFKFVAGGKQTNSMKTVTTLRAYPPKTEQNRGGVSRVSERQGSSPLAATTNQEADNALIDLDALQQRHQQEREKVAMMRQNMQVS